MIAAPDHSKCQILDRQHRKEIEPTGETQQERKRPERRDRYGQQVQADSRSGVEQIKVNGDCVAEEWAKQMADQEHARPLMGFVVALDRLGNKPVENRIDSGRQNRQPSRGASQKGGRSAHPENISAAITTASAGNLRSQRLTLSSSYRIVAATPRRCSAAWKSVARRYSRPAMMTFGSPRSGGIASLLVASGRDGQRGCRIGVPVFLEIGGYTDY